MVVGEASCVLVESILVDYGSQTESTKAFKHPAATSNKCAGLNILLQRLLRRSVTTSA